MTEGLGYVLIEHYVVVSVCLRAIGRQQPSVSSLVDAQTR